MIVVTLFAFACSYLRFEWSNAPNASVMLGPLWMAWYGERSGWGLAGLLLPCVFAVLIKPNNITFMVSLIALFSWLVLGMLGQGIGC